MKILLIATQTQMTEISPDCQEDVLVPMKFRALMHGMGATAVIHHRMG